jgi:hypothetical protein
MTGSGVPVAIRGDPTKLRITEAIQEGKFDGVREAQVPIIPDTV